MNSLILISPSKREAFNQFFLVKKAFYYHLATLIPTLATITKAFVIASSMT